jgi:PAS domain S-box-containing protein
MTRSPDPSSGDDAMAAQLRFWEAMHALSLDLSAGSEIDTLLQNVVDRAAAITEAPFAELLMPEGDELVVRAYTANQPFLKGDRITREEGPISWQAADSGKIVIVDDYAADPRARSIYRDPPHGPTANIPITFDGACLGVIEVARVRDDRAFSPLDLQHGVILAQLLGVIIQNANDRTTLERELAERTAAETALRESEDRYRDLVEHSDILFSTHDLDGRLLSVNAAACTSTGYSHAELLRMNLRDLVIPEFVDVVPLYLARIRRRGHARGVMAVRTADGQRRDWVYDNTLRTDGDRPVVRGIARDETARLAAERAARESEANLRAVARNAPIGIVVVQDGRYVFVNDQFAEMFGYAPGELVRQPHSVIIHPDERATIQDLSRRRVAGEEVPELYETTGMTADGRSLPIQVTAALMTWSGAPASLGFIRDISLRQKITGELQSARDRLEATLAAVPDLLFVLDRDGRFLDFRANQADLLAVPPEVFLGRLVTEVVPPPVAAQVLAAMKEARESGQSIGRQYALEVPAGLRTFELSIGRRGEGEGETFVVLARDISYRQLVDEALRFLSTGIGPLRGETLYVAMATRAAALLGADFGFVSRVDPDHQVARTIVLVGDGTPVPAVTYRLPEIPGSTIVADGAASAPQPPRHPLAETLGIHHCTAIPLLDTTGRLIGEIGIGRREPREGPERSDEVLRFFAVRAAAELERERAEGMFQGLFEFAPDAIIAVDGEGRIADLNSHAVDLFGYSRQEAIGQPIEILVPSEFHGRHVNARRAFMAEPGRRMMASDRTELRAIRRDGTRFPVEISLGPIDAEDGPRIVAIVRDVSDRRSAEEERRSLEAQLRQSQRLEAIGTLAGGIAHDFNNILTTIIGNTELAALDAPAGGSLAETLDEIRRAGHRARALVRQILAFSRRREETDRRPQPLAPIIEEVAGLLRAALPAGAALRVVVDPKAPDVLVDSSQIHQVLMNLGTNAWQALPSGVGTIEIRLDDARVGRDEERTEHSLRPGRYARLQVIDTGSGIDAATAERIFEPFFTTKDPGQGTGLGLAVVHGIVLGHGGEVTVHSTPGVGTTMEILLPAVESAAPPAPRPTPQPDRGSGQVIACVDDEAAIVRLTARVLELAGYSVMGFTNAADMLVVLGENPGAFDALLTDLNMPGISGLELAREALLLRPDLPIGLTSGYLTDELIREAKAVGVREIVHKPSDTASLVGAIARLFGG